MLPGRHVVAGAAGLMGTFTLLRLRNQPGVEVIATVHQRPPLVEGANIRCLQADLTSLEDCRRVLEGADYLWLLAARLATAPVVAKDPLAHMTSNMLINANMLEAAWKAGLKKVLWLSSSTAYPDQEKPLQEEDFFRGDPPANHFAVGWMTRYTEALCRMYATILSHPLTIIAFRPTTIYGEYESFDFERAHVLPALVRKVVERQQPLEVWGSGEELRDFIYGDDVLDACLAALNVVNAGFEVLNLGYGREYRIREVLEIILRQDGFKDAELVYNQSKPSSVLRKTLDLTRIKARLGFQPKTDLESGIQKMLEWYRQGTMIR